MNHVTSVFARFLVIVLIKPQVDLIVAIWHHPLACHDSLAIYSALLTSPLISEERLEYQTTLPNET